MKNQAGREPEQAQRMEEEARESRAGPACDGNNWESPVLNLTDLILTLWTRFGNVNLGIPMG